MVLARRRVRGELEKRRREDPGGRLSCLVVRLRLKVRDQRQKRTSRLLFVLRMREIAFDSGKREGRRAER